MPLTQVPYVAPPGYKLVPDESLSRHVALKVTPTTWRSLTELGDTLGVSPNVAVRWLLDQQSVRDLIAETVALSVEVEG